MSSMTTRQDLEHLVHRATRRIRDLSFRSFGSENPYRFVHQGADGTPSSWIDERAEEIIFDEIRNSSFRTCNIHSEESGLVDRGSNRTLIIDPIDGTRSASVLLDGTVSIAIADRRLNQTIEQSNVTDLRHGCVGHIFSDQIFSATIGEGASLWIPTLDLRHDLTKQQSLASIVDSYRLRCRIPESYYLRLVGHHLALDSYSHTIAINTPGAPASICMTQIAAGNQDVFLGFGYKQDLITWGLKTVDFAGAYPIVKETGGEVYDFDSLVREGVIEEQPYRLLHSLSEHLSEIRPIGKQTPLELQRQHRLLCVRSPEVLEHFDQAIRGFEADAER